VLLAEQREDQRRKEHEQSMHQFLTLKQSVERERAEMKEKALRELTERNEEMKETWKRHEDTVQNVIKSICQRHAIEYVTNVPFKGKPDNVISICGDHIVFDAKSPASDDLTNFNTYIRSQAEVATKYTSCDSVCKDIYLVVPSNTLGVLRSRRFDLGNYTVTVLTVDALEPVIESLKKLEEYEFAEQLRPEDRQSICRIVGSYIYMTKRRIQVDQDFNSHALELLSRTDREIPEVMHEEISKHEKAMKINPAADRRSKAISQEVLEKTQAQQAGQANAFKILEEEVGLVLNR
jgi:predicted Holliday junction resolvase-like endonuclease